MELLYLTSLVSGINVLIDTGKYNSISVEEIRSHIETGDILAYLEETLGSASTALNLPKGDSREIFEAWYVPRLRDIEGGGSPHKWGVNNIGLCLLLAWTVQIIQKGEDILWPPYSYPVN